MDSRVRLATPADAPIAGRLLHDFNTEYDDITPGPQALAERLGPLIENGDAVLFLGDLDDAPVAVAVLRLRRAIFTEGLTAYLEELYVAPDHRGKGLGRAMLEAIIETSRERGASWLELGTSEDDHAARALYESAGFINREGGPDGPVSYMYEREL